MYDKITSKVRVSFGMGEALFKLINWSSVLILGIILTNVEYAKLSLSLAYYSLFEGLYSTIIDKYTFHHLNKEENKSLKITLIITVPIALLVGFITYSELSIFSISIIVGILFAHIIQRSRLSHYRLLDREKEYFYLRLKQTVILFILLIVLQFFIKDHRVYLISFLGALIVPNIQIPFNYQRPSSHMVKKILIFSIPFILSGVSKNIYKFYDRVLIVRYLDLPELSSYMFLLTISGVTTFSQYISNVNYEADIYKNNLSLRKFISKSLLLNLLTIPIGLIIYRISLLFNPEYTGLEVDLFLLMLGNTLTVFVTVAVKSILTNRENFKIPFIYIIPATFSLCLNPLSIPYLGIRGASLVYLTVMSIQVLICLFFLLRSRK